MKTHECHDSWIPMRRLLLAALNTNNLVGDDLAVAELGDCVDCWRAVALTAISGLANEQALRMRSRQAAAENVANEIKQYRPSTRTPRKRRR
ncbi:hypothetical protein A5660_25055 [Mycobacterium alsense]|uniref:hypothetical protein n=1 Tax=Mycobacterium alsense TaxID=324058 RepID=UPI0007FC5DFE|nr:hypothetical protein [Mycobacterium alsense]OBJ00364.1 hypothetical protein A5660_25055 [Mycobacterium alsense]